MNISNKTKHILVNIRTAFLILLAVLFASGLGWVVGSYELSPEFIYHGLVNNIVSVSDTDTVVIITPDKNISAPIDLRIYDGQNITKLSTYDSFWYRIESLNTIPVGEYWIYKVHNHGETYYLFSATEILRWNDTEGWDRLKPNKDIVPVGNQ